MFQFGGFPILTDYREFIAMGSPIRQSPHQRLLAPTRSNIAAWHDLHQLPSLAIHQMAQRFFVQIAYDDIIDPKDLVLTNRFFSNRLAKWTGWDILPG